MKALGLLSGGLDSILAIKTILDQGIEVIPINFTSPFCQCSGKKGCGHEAKKVADNFKLDLKIVNINQEYLEMLKKPKHGYGKNMNPCIDCRILMLKTAKKQMKELGASFVFTGEVLGQRPMSQHRRALETIERESDLEGLILRPLSAKLMPPTIPEEKGWVNRENLLKIHGRSRKQQIDMAAACGINEYPCPAGGCLLTDKSFSNKIRDLIENGELTFKEIILLKLGRHFRINSKLKVVIGRDEEESNRIINLIQPDDLLLEPLDISGPSAIMRGKYNNEDIAYASRIVARYCNNLDKSIPIVITYTINGNQNEQIEALPLSDSELNKIRIL